MTVIAAIRHKNRYLIGADSRVTFGESRCEECDDKIFERHGITYAGCGDSLLIKQAQLLNVRRPSPKKDVRKWALLELSPALREMTEELQKTSKEPIFADFLVAFGSHLFTAQTNGDIHGACRDYTALGTGAEYALGALAVLDLSVPVKAMQQAIEAAALHCPTVGGPVRMAWAR